MSTDTRKEVCNCPSDGYGPYCDYCCEYPPISSYDEARQERDIAVKALKSAQAYIRAQQPSWAKAEDMPPIMHEIATALDSIQ